MHSAPMPTNVCYAPNSDRSTAAVCTVLAVVRQRASVTGTIGTPTVCAVRPIGSRTHNPDEHVELGSAVPLAQILALIIIRSGKDFA